MPDEFMTVLDVATLLKLNQQTIRNRIDRGELPAVRVGRSVRIKRSDFDRLIEAGYTGKTKPSSEQRSGATGEVSSRRPSSR